MWRVIVRERRGLRLHAVRIGRNDRFGVIAREREHFFARARQRLELPKKAVAQVHAGDRRRDVLAAAPRVQA
jgi:hypothetical protein